MRQSSKPGPRKSETKKLSRWRYMGPNWGWATLASGVVDVLLFIGERKNIIHLDPSYWVVTWVVICMPIFCYYMWVGAREFFGSPTGG